MPLIDYDLHPVALAFGIFCFLLTSALIAAVVYIGTSDGEPTPSPTSTGDPGDAPPFLADESPPVTAADAPVAADADAPRRSGEG